MLLAVREKDVIVELPKVIQESIGGISGSAMSIVEDG
jgi:hypothetical protein